MSLTMQYIITGALVWITLGYVGYVLIRIYVKLVEKREWDRDDEFYGSMLTIVLGPVFILTVMVLLFVFFRSQEGQILEKLGEANLDQCEDKGMEVITIRTNDSSKSPMEVAKEKLEELHPDCKVLSVSDVAYGDLPPNVKKAIADMEDRQAESIVSGTCMDCGKGLPVEEWPPGDDFKIPDGWSYYTDDEDTPVGFLCPSCERKTPVVEG